MSKKISSYDVLLYYPNLVGYTRIVFMFLAFYMGKTSWKVTTLSYFLAFIGDTIDGHIARMFKQTSKFGGILDMVTDRVSTTGFLVILSHLYPDHLFIFIVLIVLDIGSHWFHVNSVSVHHKSIEALRNRNFLLRKYYEIYSFFVYCIAGTEAFYALLYVLYFNCTISILFYICWIVCFPACVLKQLINIAQLVSAIHAIAEADANEINK